jgi:hypothetical protein
MKQTFFIILVLAFQTVFAQSPPVGVLSQKWSERVEMSVLRNSDPFVAASSEATVGPGTSSSSQSISGVKTNKFFVYETVIKNESKQNIYGLSWDYVFYDAAGKVEKSRRSFILTRKIKPQKKEAVLGKTTNPPDLVLDVKDFEKGAPKYQERVEITCVIFEDNTLWKREGTDQKVCEELRDAISAREEKRRKHGLKYE